MPYIIAVPQKCCPVIPFDLAAVLAVKEAGSERTLALYPDHIALELVRELHTAISLCAGC